MNLFLHGFGLLLIIISCAAFQDDVIIPEDWVEPHAWASVQKVSGTRNKDATKDATDKPEPRESCPVDESLVFYRRLVNFLFDTSKLRKSPDGDQMFRSLHLLVTPKILEKLKEARTARDLDSVVFEVIELSRDGKLQQAKEIVMSYVEIFTFYLNEIYNSDTLLFITLAMTTLSFVWFVSRRMQRNIVLVFILTIVAISYLLMYMDCNRRLEIKKLLQLNRENEGNPCEVTSSWSLWSSRSSYSEDECMKHLLKKFGPQRSICGPTEVLLEFFSHITMEQFSTFVYKAATSFKEISANYSITENILLLPLILFFTTFMLITIFKYVFKYVVPTVVTNLNDHGVDQTQKSQNVPQIDSGSDRLVLSGQSVEKLLNLLRQNSTVSLTEAAGALETADGDRVQILPNTESQVQSAILEKDDKESEKLEKPEKESENNKNPEEITSKNTKSEANP
ncbi:uncharacterized protein LOC132257238 [Phlebotomus argentipes]|uniref:uncharacterized protein LOC132257238 n=1 Tax=Phlebotomus argentipes TaxID=94469 RepID=UPI0028937B08|nr:uncharacterized protein LOC132257238 [Phlebotomus argentipes]